MRGNVGAKERIMETVVNLLMQKTDMTTITNRHIAALAGVNSALINYYYQSKENLLYSAVGVCMGNVFEEIIEKSTGNTPPIERLKHMVKAIAEVAFDNYSLAEIAFTHDMGKGSVDTTQMLLPLLKEIYGDTKSETELKVLGLQLIIPLQSLFLNAKDYKNFLLFDIWNTSMRNEMIDKMVNNIISV